MPERHEIGSNADGENISAVQHGKNSDRWIFFCHGFGSDKEGSYVERCEKAVENNWNAVRFDFRGNGESDGKFIEQDLSSRIEDLESVIDYFSPSNFVLFGSSFGGKVAIHASAKLSPEALVLRAPVTYNEIMEKYRAVVEEKGEFQHHPGATIDHRFYDDFDTYSFEDVTGNIKAPVLIFHGSDDSTVHIENSFRAAEILENDVMLQKFEGEDHSFSSEAEEKMQELMFRWLETLAFKRL